MGRRTGRLVTGVLTGLLLATFHSVPAQGLPPGDSLPPRYRVDSSFIIEYKHKLTGRFFILYQESKLIYQDPDLGDIVLKPNLVYKVGVAGFYSWFGLGLSYYSPLSIKRADEYGKTKAYDFRINVYGKSYMIESYAQWMKGFYVSNLQTPTGEYYTNPSLRLISIGASGYYILNSQRFSMRAAVVQTERQKKSAGSFMARLNLSYGNIKSDSGLIPQQLLRDYKLDPGGRFTQGNYYLSGVAPGYGYTWVFLKYFYINGDAFLGAGWSVLSGRDSSGNAVRLGGFGLQFNPRLAMGYNSDKWFIGGSATMGIWQLSALSDYSLTYDAPQFRIWVGTRFNVGKHRKK